MATYAIGDIQGCYRELRKLLKKIQFSASRDHLICVGDQINRGPQSLETVQLLMDLGDSATCLLGNHDLHFMAVAAGIGEMKNGDTLAPLLDSPELPEMVHWMRNLELVHYHQDFDCLLVHAGVPREWDLDDTLDAAAQLEARLQGDKCLKYFKNMYGNRPALWDDDLTGKERLRYITNAFTRMRFCYSDGRLDMSCKLKPGFQPEYLKPWFELNKRMTAELPIIFGHWAALEGHTGDSHAIAIDTGCVWGGSLTAYRLDDGQRFAVKAKKKPANISASI